MNKKGRNMSNIGYKEQQKKEMSNFTASSSTIWMYVVNTLSLLLLMTVSTVHASYAKVSEEICSSETFTAQCQDNQVIVVDSADFGRMRIGKCVQSSLGYLGCKKSVITIMDSICSGTNFCSIQVPSPEMEKSKPCFAELKSHMEITYHCQHVLLSTSKNCDNYDYNDNITITRGNISNHINVVGKSFCGSENEPWIITGKSGQTINLYLIDFSLDDFNSYAQDYGDSNIQVCQPYGTIKDVTDKDSRQICGGQGRRTHLHRSLGNQVEIVFNPEMKEKKFMIYFEVLGCPDETPPDGVWYKRLTPDRAAMGCSSAHAELTWYLHCEGHAWVGSRGNCSIPLELLDEDPHPGNKRGMHYGLAIVIIIGAALGVGSVIVVVGFYRYRRRENGELATAYTTQTMLLRQRPADEYEMRCTCPVPPPSQKVHETLVRPHRAPPESRQQTLHRSPQVPRHYSLSQTVTVNGNEYEHIWQTPLPKPRTVRGSSSDDTSTPPPEHSPMEDGSGEYTKYNTDNSQTDEPDRDRPYYIRSKDIYDATKKDDCRTTSSTGYSTLRKNNTKNAADTTTTTTTTNNNNVISNRPADV